MIIPLEQKTPTGQHSKRRVAEHSIHGAHRKAPQDVDDELSKEIRVHVAEIMNSETLLCPIDKFLTHYGPYKVDPNDMKECKAVLVDAGLLQRSGREYGWSRYQTKPSEMAAYIDPDNKERTEPKIFAHLFEIVKKIYSYAGERQGNKYKSELVPYRYLMAAIGGANRNMDACIVEEQTPGKLDVSTGVVPHEFVVRREAVDQTNVRQNIVGDCQYIMCDDPRRMFMFGVTIEDAFFSLYYFSRSHSVKALAFDWLTGKGADRFIEIYLAFAFAQPADLGVDPFVQKAAAPRADDTDGQQYIYKLPDQEMPAPSTDAAQVDGRVTRQATTVAREQAEAERLKNQGFKYFKTVQAIHPRRSYRICGRRTRIWKVTEVKSFDDEEPVEPGKYAILKDVWLEEDKPNEAENMAQIFGAVEERLARAKEDAGGGDDDWMARFMQTDPHFADFDQATKDRLRDLLTDGKYKSLFLTKMHAWKGSVSKEVSTAARYSRTGVDIFARVKRVDEEPQGDRRASSTQWTHGGTQRNPSGPQQPTARDVKDRRTFHRYAPRQQSRFVYEEVCLELADVKTMGNFMRVISQALDAVQILYCAGWVHRDISEGNILTYVEDGEWKAKLSDLEFSKMLGYADSRTDPRAGTPYYMPHEVLTAEYLLTNHRDCAERKSLAVHLGLPVGSPAYTRLKVINKNFCDRFAALPPNATDTIPQHRATVRYNFQHDLESVWWLVVFYLTACVGHEASRVCTRYVFEKTLTPPGERIVCFEQNFVTRCGRFLHPDLKGTFSGVMETLRTAMYEEYVAREAFGQIHVPESYSYIHGLFATTFSALLQHNDDGWQDLDFSLVPNSSRCSGQEVQVRPALP